MIGPGSCIRLPFRHYVLVGLVFLAGFLLLSQGCFGCLAPLAGGRAYVENPEAFQDCLAAAAAKGRGPEVRQLLETDPEELSVAEGRELAGQLKELGLERECGPALEALREQAPELPTWEELKDATRDSLPKP